ncbi:MAG TPA: DNA repair protein RadC, partial [Planctomycetota bacterium]|nr:DNA repair protein RadC [Planctomycetota bacterium]
ELLQIPWRAALRLACAFELGRRTANTTRSSRAPIRTPRDAFELVHGALHGRERETVVALYLDGRHRLLQLHEVSVGTATASLIHPREVFGPALRAGACAIVVAHNHPSGDPEPSAEDRGVTERLFAAGELVGVPLLDHLVVGGGTFVSLRGRGAWANMAPQERPRS